MESSDIHRIKSVFESENQSPDYILNRVVEKVGEILNVDRVFLCVRDPTKQRCQTPFIWRRHESIPGDYFQGKWVDESSFVDDDPLYRAALSCEPSRYITDVSKTSSDILNE